MATGATGAGPEPLGAGRMGPWARDPGSRPPLPPPGLSPAAARARARAHGPMCPWTQGAQGLGPGACGPCGHVFSQERYRHHIK